MLLPWSLVFRLWSGALALAQQHRPRADQQQREHILVDIEDIRQHQHPDSQQDEAQRAAALALPRRGYSRLLELHRRWHRQVGVGWVDAQIDGSAGGRLG